MSATTTAPAPVPEASATPAATETSPETTANEIAPKPEPGATPVPPTTAAATPAAPAPTAAPSEPTTAPTPTTKEDGKDEPEPQNKLTKQFTDAEWKALKTLRSQLPDIFAAAYESKPELKSGPATLWGVPIDPSKPASDARVSVILVKFLRARNLKVEEAKKMLINTLKWRDVTFDIQSALKEDFPQDVFGKIAHIAGKDKEGRPVVYNLYGANKDFASVFGDVDRFIRWRVAVQERTVLQLDFENIDQTVQVHDYEGAPGRTPESKKAASEASSIFGDHYPELLKAKFFVSVPGYATWIFWAFKPILPAATFSKMFLVGQGKETIKKALLPTIEESQLPTYYGGKLDAGF